MHLIDSYLVHSTVYLWGVIYIDTRMWKIVADMLLWPTKYPVH